MYKIINSTKIHHSKITEKKNQPVKHALKFFTELLSASPREGGCLQKSAAAGDAGFLGTFVTSVLLLHLPNNLSRHGGMEIDCMVPQALSCLVTLSTATFKWLPHTDLCSVAVLGMVFYTIHILWEKDRIEALEHTVGHWTYKQSC